MRESEPEDTLYTERSYKSYGLLDEYGEFRRKFWNLIIGYTGLSDWRFELEDWGGDGGGKENFKCISRTDGTHVLYTNGEHVEIQLENGRLSEAYNDFRDELWDAMIPYVNEGQVKKAPDWRDPIDQWGKGYI